MRSVSYAIAVIALAGMSSGCSEYYENRVDRLYAQCGAPDLAQEEVTKCSERVTRLQASYPSPRLDELQRQLEGQVGDARSADLGSSRIGEVAGSDAEGERGYGEESYGESDFGGLPASPDVYGTSEGDAGYDEQLEPYSETMLPPEPQEPNNPDEQQR